MTDALRVIYAGTPEFAVPALQSLIESHHEVVAVYTQPDRPAGRGRKLQASPVKQVAEAAGISVEQPENFRDELTAQQLAEYDADVMVVAAYGIILPQLILDTPRFGCLNIHGSLLPRWRGAAPIQRAILAGDTETGVTIMQMAAGLDTGDMLLKTHCPITASDTTASIHDTLAGQGSIALQEVLSKLRAGELSPEVQDESKTTYAAKFNKTEAEINWQDSAASIDLLVRAFNPWPIAFTHKGGKPLRIYLTEVLDDKSVSAVPGSVLSESKEGIQISTGEGVLNIKKLQFPGGKPLAVNEFLNGRSLQGEQFPS
jgi:methionyl-tRNA formyltransferase